MAAGKTKKTEKDGSTVVKNYLIGYNFVQTIGWLFLMYQLVDFYVTPSRKSLYNTVKWSLFIFQNGAMLEVLHALFGFVRSSYVITAMQVASRVVVVCGVLMVTKAATESIGFPLLLFAWSMTEVIRYGNYTCNLLGHVPYFLVWLRYTTFIALYPMGVSGELLCLYAAQDEVERTQIFTIAMPNFFNMAFYYQHFLCFVMLLYIPLFPKLYMHMFSQRKKVLGKEKK